MSSLRRRVGVVSESFSKHPHLIASLEKEVGCLADLVYLSDQEALCRFPLSSLDGIVVGRERCGKALIDLVKPNGFVAKYGVGLDNVNLEYLESCNIKLLHRSGVNAVSVAELTIGLAISCYRRLFESSYAMRQGHWKRTYGFDIAGKKVCVIGLGHVGSRVAKLFRAFDADVFGIDIVSRLEWAKENRIKIVGYDTCFSVFDIISLHVPLTDQTRGLIDANFLSKMSSKALLLNTARGEIVRSKDLYEALRVGRLLGAGMDVFEDEPVIDNPLIQLDNFVGSAHIGGSSWDAIECMGQSTVQLIKAYLLEN